MHMQLQQLLHILTKDSGNLTANTLHFSANEGDTPKNTLLLTNKLSGEMDMQHSIMKIYNHYIEDENEKCIYMLKH